MKGCIVKAAVRAQVGTCAVAAKSAKASQNAAFAACIATELSTNEEEEVLHGALTRLRRNKRLS
jgi:hypothetical protein